MVTLGTVLQDDVQEMEDLLARRRLRKLLDGLPKEKGGVGVEALELVDHFVEILTAGSPGVQTQGTVVR